ncbi:MAG: hypothetical protein Q9195_004184 [Heterodermia aff. obscurata]
MLFHTVLLTFTLAGITAAAPVTKDVEGKAVINTRFLKYENKPRDAIDDKNAVINTRFLTYELGERDVVDEKNAVINTRFLSYELGERDAGSEAAPIKPRVMSSETERTNDAPK